MRLRIVLVRVQLPLLGLLALLALLVLPQCTPTAPAARPPLPTVSVAATPPSPCPAGMGFIPGGTYTPAAALTAPSAKSASAATTVAGYCLDLTEVTVRAFQQCVDAGHCARPDAYGDTEENRFCNYGNPRRAEHPVNCVDWTQATEYCAWSAKRLPTDDEWEWAARNGDRGDTYPWGSAAPDGTQANACGQECVAHFKANGLGPTTGMYAGGDGWPETAPVGSYPRGDNRWGVHDLGGNVVEWIGSRWDPTEAPDDDAYRPLRGGYWGSDYAEALAASQRTAESAQRRQCAFGFRCASAVE